MARGGGSQSTTTAANTGGKPIANQASFGSDHGEEVSSESSSAFVSGLSNNQCQQLIALLSSQLQGASHSSNDQKPMVSNFTGISSSIPPNVWILDTGATHHIGMGKRIGNLDYLVLPDSRAHSIAVCNSVIPTSETLWHYRLATSSTQSREFQDLFADQVLPTSVFDHVSSPDPSNVVHTHSTRAVKKPSYLQDYHYALASHSSVKDSSLTSYPLSQFLDYRRLSLPFKAAVLSVSSQSEPESYYQASGHSAWEHAMSAEMDALEANKTWSIIGPDELSLSYLTAVWWQEYEKNPYDEKKNPKGIIQMGLAENQLCFDLLESWLNNLGHENCM
ncbi:hypothetical protein EZV62_014477 [Acer yangbiense]|uniref:Uncharacterized protein n=1 Tax=Acer yangbiense TaxID=1000413 RepID=A0A5C7HSY5_9ROSI|nr:hypothetical protein EZV62_014477 [Acer yangbiense]